MSWARRVDAFRSSADAIDPLLGSVSDCEAPGLGVWSVADLVAHTMRALETTRRYAEAPEPAGPPTISAAGYYDAYLSWRAHDPEAADAAVAARSSSMVDDPGLLPDRWAAAKEASLEVLGSARPERLVDTPFGPLALADYLRTRTLELVVHGLDLARAIGDDTWKPPRDAVGDAVSLLGDLAVMRGSGPGLLLAMTGREGAPDILPILR